MKLRISAPFISSGDRHCFDRLVIIILLTRCAIIGRRADIAVI
jgi:hypothetical protein